MGKILTINNNHLMTFQALLQTNPILHLAKKSLNEISDAP